MADPVLSAVLSGQRAILLSWAFGSNADFQVFWKSSVPAGQEMVLLASTNAFSYTTPDLEPSKTYTFYVRANVGATFFYSNTVELFVSCGKGVVLSADPPTAPPPQIVVDEWIYTAVDGGDIYKYHLGTGDWIPLNQTSRAWVSLTVCPNEDVWACTSGVGSAGDMYKQSGGAGNFVAMGYYAPFGGWKCVVSASNGDLYAQSTDGAFGYFIQPSGQAGFTFISQPSTGPLYIKSGAGTKGGDVYLAAGSSTGPIWKRTGGAGVFNQLGTSGSTPQAWAGTTFSRGGNLYVCSYPGTYGGVGRYPGGLAPLEYALGISVSWSGIVSSNNGKMYAISNQGDLFKIEGEIGTSIKTLISGLTQHNGTTCLAITDWWK